jgi:hypothetical protein
VLDPSLGQETHQKPSPSTTLDRRTNDTFDLMRKNDAMFSVQQFSKSDGAEASEREMSVQLSILCQLLTQQYQA